MKQTIEKTLFWLYVALVAITPLIFTSSTAEVYEFPKMFFVYFVGATIIFLYLLRGVLFGFGKLKRPDLLVSGYFLVTLVSVLFSSHLYTSVWGYYSRFNGGLISFLVFFGLYFVALNFFDEKKKQSLLEAAALSVLPVSLYAVSQAFSVDRVFSTFGQPNWLAAYLVFLLPLVLERMALQDEKPKKLFWSFVSLIALISLWFTRSLSGILGLVFVIGYLVFTFGNKLWNKWGAVAIISFLIVVGLNFTFFKDRIVDSLNFSTDSSSYNVSDPGLIRLGLWRGSLNMGTSSVKNFLVGTGPETFPYEYPFHRDEVLNYSSEWDFILNKSHNYFIELFVESGIIAVLLYAAILWGFLRSKERFLVAGFLGFYVTNFFGWPTVHTSLLFWLWLGLRSDTSQ